MILVEDYKEQDNSSQDPSKLRRRVVQEQISDVRSASAYTACNIGRVAPRISRKITIFIRITVRITKSVG